MSATLAVVRFDLAIVRSYLKTLGLFLASMAALTFLNGPLTALPIFTVIGTIVASYPFAIGERDRTDLLLGSLPVARSSIVLGRYLFALLSLLGMLVAGMAVALLVQATREGEPMSGAALAVTAAACFAFFCLMIAVQFPLYFRYGYTKARLINVLPVALIGAIGGVVLAGGNGARLVEAARGAFSPLGVLVVLALGVALVAASLAWTARAYARKDL